MMPNDIIRDNPYDQPNVINVSPQTIGGPKQIDVPQQIIGGQPTINVPEQIITDNSITLPEQTVTGTPYDPRIAAALGPGTQPPSTSPLSNTDYSKYLVQSGEDRKDTVAKEATSLARGQDQIAKINREAEAEQRRMVFGNPEELLKAQQSLSAANALPPTDPNRQAQIQQAQVAIQSNAGARPLLQQAMVDAQARDNALRAEIQKARSERIDPDHWWNQKSTGSKLLAGIGMVLGGAGGGLGRTGRNPAMDVMNTAITNDIDAQRHHIDNHWKSIATEHGLNQDVFNRELHRQTWENNFRTSALEHVKLQLSEAAATTQSETVKNNAVNMIQSLSDEQMKLRNNQWILGVQAQQAELNRIRALSKEADTDVQKLMEKDGVSFHDAVDAVYSRPYFRGLVGAGMAPPELGRKAAEQLKMGRRIEQLEQNGLTPEHARAVAEKEFPEAKPLGVIVPKTGTKDTEMARTVTIDGVDYLGRTTKEAEESKVAIESATEVIKLNKKIGDLTAKARGNTLGLGPKDRAELDALLAQGALHYPRMQTGSTRINETEIKMGKDTYSGEGDYFRGDAFGRQQARIATITAQAEARIQDAKGGLTPVGKAANSSGAAKTETPATAAPAPKGPAKGLEK